MEGVVDFEIEIGRIGAWLIRSLAGSELGWFGAWLVRGLAGSGDWLIRGIGRFASLSTPDRGHVPFELCDCRRVSQRPTQASRISNA